MDKLSRRGPPDALKRATVPVVPPTPLELRVKHFQRWEREGRGYDLHRSPVPLEPGYVPFWHHPGASPYPIDDGRVEGAPSRLMVFLFVVSGLFFILFLALKEIALLVFFLLCLAGGIVCKVVTAREGQRGSAFQVPSDLDSLDLEPGYRYEEEGPLVLEPPPLSCMVVRLAPDQEVSLAAAEGLLLSLRYAKRPVSFEVVGTDREIVFQFLCDEADRPQLESQLQTFFPGAGTSDNRDRLAPALEGAGSRALVIDFGLDREFFQPIRSFRDFRVDPLSGGVGALSNLREGEKGALQVLFVPVRNEWGESIRRAVIDYDGKPFFADGQEMVRLANLKASKPLFAAVVRLIALGSDSERSWDLARHLGGGLEVFSEPGSNSLIALDNEGYDPELHLGAVLDRITHRSGMILNSQELAGLVHPPSSSIVQPKLARLEKREAPVATEYVFEGILIGINRYRGREVEVRLSSDLRNRHLYMLGSTRSGKSTLMLNMAAQDLRNGEGLCVIDPHGDLARDILPLVPENRVEDTVYLDFCDREHPVALNALENASEREKDLLCSDLLVILSRIFATSWGDRLEHVLRYAILTLLEGRDHTLRDIKRVLTIPAFREEAMGSISDPDLLEFWREEFLSYGQATFMPIYNKLGRFLASPIVRNVVAQTESKVDFLQAIKDRKAIICNLSQGEIGEDNSHLLGALLVSKIQVAAMTMVGRPREQRPDFYLYVDEFQNFLVSSFEKILSEAGKSRLGLILANQFLDQLEEKVRKAVLGNVGTLICFKSGIEDARHLRSEFNEPFSDKDLLSLERGETIVRMGTSAQPFNMATFAPPERPGKDFAEEIVRLSRERYSTPKNTVEGQLRDLSLRQEGLLEPEDFAVKDMF